MTQLQASPHRLAVVLFSGGLDSTTLIAMARAQGYRVLALSFRYGQRQAVELSVAARGARAWGCEAHRVIDIDLAVFGGSALTDHSLAVPKDAHTKQIPITYVPARNTIFLSYALAWAEVVGASDIFIGVNAVDYSGYPDCRPQFVEAYQQLANVATAAESRGRPAYQIHAPLLHLSKAEIIEKGTALGVDYAETHSCYDPDSSGAACARCDACRLRRAGFMAAGVPDPTRYTASA